LVLLEQIITQILSRKNITSVGISFVGEEDVVRCYYCDGGLRHNLNLQWQIRLFGEATSVSNFK
jgi:hypothetical protein